MQKKLLVLSFLTFTCLDIFSQVTFVASEPKLNIYAGMGIDYITTPSFNDYLKSEIFHSNTDSVKAFTIGLEFFGGIEYNLNKKISLRLDYSYLTRSLSYKYFYFNYDYFYYLHQPYFMGSYNINYKNSQLKLSVGSGILLGTLYIENSPSVKTSYKSTGLGVKGEILFVTKLSDNLSSYISGIITGNFMGKLKDRNGNILQSSQEHQEAGLSGFGVGLRIGLQYKIY